MAKQQEMLQLTVAPVAVDARGPGAKSRQRKKARQPRAGDLCPTCQGESLGYDGCLNLSCPKCGIISGGCFT